MIKMVSNGVNMHGKKLINNSIISVGYKITILLLGLITRKIFLIYIGEELLGLNSLYANLLDLLNLADLGIGVAVQFQLYEPLVKQDYTKLSKIMGAAKKIYNTIGTLILILGIVLAFFIQHLIRSTTYPLWYVRVSFLISVSGVAFGYFFVHKRLFLQANEELGLVNILDLLAKIITVILSLISTVLFRNYFIYLLLNAAYGGLSNLIIHFIFKKRYPLILTDTQQCSNEVGRLLGNLKNVVPMKLSNYVYNSTDNVVVSKVLGLTTVALYSNYMTIINGIMGIEYLIGNAVTSSIGKIIAKRQNTDTVYQIYLTFQYIQFLFTSFCTVSLAMLSKPFISLWIGEQFLIEDVCFALLVVDFFIHSMYQQAYVMYGATGKFQDDKYITIASAVMNIAVSVALVGAIGLPGVILGTLITDIYIWAVRSYQMVKGYWNENLCVYVIKMILYSALTAAGLIISLKIGTFVFVDSFFLELIIKAAICCIVPNLINILATFKSRELKSIIKSASNYIHRGKTRK